MTNASMIFSFKEKILQCKLETQEYLSRAKTKLLEAQYDVDMYTSNINDIERASQIYDQIKNKYKNISFCQDWDDKLFLVIWEKKPDTTRIKYEIINEHDWIFISLSYTEKVILDGVEQNIEIIVRPTQSDIVDFNEQLSSWVGDRVLLYNISNNNFYLSMDSFYDELLQNDKFKKEICQALLKMPKADKINALSIRKEIRKKFLRMINFS